MEGGVWTVFCNDSEGSLETEKTWFSGFLSILDPHSCINEAFIISFDILLLLICLFIYNYKLSAMKIMAPSHSPHLLIFSAIFNGILGLAYLGFGFFVLGKKLYEDHAILPLLNWLVMLFQGFTWLLLGLSISLNKLHLPHYGIVKFCSILIFLYAGFLCVFSLWEAIVEKAVTVKMVLDIFSFPGAILLLFRASQRHNHVDSDPNNKTNALYAPLQSEEVDASDEISSNDNVTPFTKAGFFSTMSFWWLNPLMKKGKEKILEDDDIPQLPPADRARSCYSIYMEHMSKQKQKGSSDPPCMLSIILLSQWKAILVSGFFALIKVLTLSTGPLFLKAFTYMASGNESAKYVAYVLAGALFLAKCLESLSERQCYFHTRLIGLQVRSLLSAAIYHKQLRLSSAAKMTHSPGEIMNYVMVDAYKIGEFPFWLHQTWSTCLQLCLALVIVYYAVGVATVPAVITIILTILASSPMAKLQSKYQMKLMVAQDKRLKAITEALANMKVLKLYAWEKHFKSVIDTSRKGEFEWISKVLLQRGYYMVLFWLPPILVPAVTLCACHFLSITLDASNVFTFLASLRIVQEQITLIPFVAGVYIEAKVSLDRIVKFLNGPELHNPNTRKSNIGEGVDWSIFIRCAEISWETDSSSKATLTNINLMVKPGEKVAICGEVGSGKSTLLDAILGEVPKINGTVYVDGKIAYVSQTAWIQTGTIKENILFGSAMDPVRYREVLEKCCLLKDLEMLAFGDLAEIGERGVNLSGGQKQRVQLARALYQDADVYLLDDPFSAVDAQTATRLFNEYVMGALSGKTVLLVTHQVDFLPAFNSILLLSRGAIVQAATCDELLASTQEFQDLVNAHTNTAGSESRSLFASRRTPVTSEGEIQKVDVKEQLKAPFVDQLIKKEERETGSNGLKPYIQYLNHKKGFLYFSLAVLLHTIIIIGQVIQSYLLAVGIQNSDVSRLKLYAIYSMIGFILAFFLLLRCFCVGILGCQTSESIFSTLLRSLFQAPISFYDSTPLGRILSRVSSDMSIIDTELAFKLVTLLGAALTAYFSFTIMGILARPILFVIIPIIYLTIVLQRYYFASAKELMRINGTTKSLVASHLAESIAGAMTIRAFGQEDRFFSKNLELIDANASPHFHITSADEWLIQRLEILCAIVLTSSALAMTLLPLGPSASGFVGMALSYGLSLNLSLILYIKSQCLAANLIISVERLEQYMHIPSEAPAVIERNRPAHNWPAFGKVEFNNVKVKYRPNAPLVLRGISCIIEGGSKIGIVGRTGSGKTTLISALFRLVEPIEGAIIIDDMNISTIGLHDLRSRLGIIPQDPTLFNGSIRYNLDPLSEHTDKQIWEVLGRCQLREVIREKEKGLNSVVVQDGSNWSVGQRQLFCLGRALLKRSRILVLDEATASIDNATDSILQKTIRREFAGSTVIAIAHRKPTVTDCNMVMAISDGKLDEYDEPMKLLEREDSLLGQLVKEYWSHAPNDNRI